MSRLPVHSWMLALGLVLACDAAEPAASTPAPKAARPKAAAPMAAAAPPAAAVEPEAAAPVLPKTAASLDVAIEQAKALFAEQSRTVLCGCRYSANDRVLAGSCGYRTRADDELAKRVEWGHLVPPQNFGVDRACWSQPLCTDPQGNRFGGIECCQDSDPQFAAMRTDLHNIVPLVGEVSRDKSDYRYGELEGEARMYGACDLEIDREGELIEPMPEVRGDVARAYLYLAETYPGALVLSARDKLTFRAWAAEDPPTEVEIQRARVITEHQGVAPGWLEAIDATAKAAAGHSEPVVQPPVDAAPLPAGQVAG